MMQKVKFVICITVYFTEATLLNLILQEKNSQAMIDCIIEMIQSSSNSTKKSSVFFSQKNMNLATGLLKSLQNPVIINFETILNHNRIPSDFVIILQADVDFTQILNMIHWNASSNFLTVCYKKEVCAETVQTFYNRYAVNSFALFEENDDILIYTFVPFSKCQKGSAVVYNRWTNGRFDHNFTKKQPIQLENMHNCPVNISVFDDVEPNVILDRGLNKSYNISGIEGKIMTVIAKKLQLNATYLIPPDGKGWGSITPEPIGIVGEVYKGLSEVGLGLLAPNTERLKHLDLSKSYDDIECVTFGVPKGAGSHEPDWLKILIFEFSPFVWGLIFLVVTFVGVILWLSKKPASNKTTLQPEQLASYICTSFLALPFKIPRNYGSFFMLMFLCYVWCSFILVVAYQSSLGSVLTIPSPDPEINTLQELAESNFQITGYENFRNVLDSDSTTKDVSKLLMEKFIVTDTDIGHTVKLVAERKISHIRQKSTLLYHMRKNWRMRGRVHLLDECVAVYYPVFVLRKNSPFTKKVNEIITLLFETGVSRHWRREYIPKFSRLKKNFQRLSLDHVLGAMALVTIGWTLSVLTFMVEIFCGYSSKAKKSVLLN